MTVGRERTPETLISVGGEGGKRLSDDLVSHVFLCVLSILQIVVQF